MKQKVVVIGHGFTSRLSIIRSVAQIGCDVTVIVMTGYKRFRKTLNKSIQIDCCSKYVNHVFYCYGKDGEGLIQLLLNKCADKNQKVIIIPDSDFSAAVIDNHQERLNKHFLFPHIRHQSGAVYAWMNKTRQKSLAQKLGMNVAQSVVVDIANQQFTIPQGIHYPCFSKPVATFDGGKKYLCKCNSEGELRQVLKRAGRSADIRFLIEDYKQIEEEFAVLGFSDGRQVIIPAVIKFREPSKSHVGIALQGEVMPTNGFEQLIRLFQEFIRRIGFFGIFDIDFYQSEGKLYFGELNLRFGASGYAVTKMGINLPGMLVKALLEEDINNKNNGISTSALFVNERMCIEDWYCGYISTKDYHRIIKSADIRFVNDKDDPAPQHAFEKLFRKKLLRRPFMMNYFRLKGIIHKVL